MLMVTGASGQLGQVVTARLRQAGVTFIAGTHGSSRDMLYRHLDFDAPDTLDFQGVETLLLISAGYDEDDVVIGRHNNVISAAERDGVRHVIYTSLTGSGDHLGFALAHRWTERRLRESGLQWTILRNGLYLELLRDLTPAQNGVVTAPLGKGKVAAVARADLAEAAVKIVLEPQLHVGKTYELVGDVALGGDELARLQGARYQPTTLTETRAFLSQAALLPFQSPMLLSIYSSIAGGFMESTEGDLTQFLDAPPRSLHEL